MMRRRHIRYVKQRDTFSCGPIAVINALKALGRHATYDDLPRYQRLCNTHFVRVNGHKGTFPSGLTEGLSRSLPPGTVVSRIRAPTESQLRHSFASGVSIVLYGYGGSGGTVTAGHYIAVVPSGEGHVDVINSSRKSPTVVRMTVDRAIRKVSPRARFRGQRRLRYPQLWTIGR